MILPQREYNLLRKKGELSVVDFLIGMAFVALILIPAIVGHLRSRENNSPDA